jgi:hypothetical protein
VTALFVCGPGPYTRLAWAWCPWCCGDAFPEALRVHAWRQVFSGYCAPDLVCGACGQYHCPDEDRLHRMREAERDENIELVRKLVEARTSIDDHPMEDPR